jgi:hypothetical protein
MNGTVIAHRMARMATGVNRLMDSPNGVIAALVLSACVAGTAGLAVLSAALPHVMRAAPTAGATVVATVPYEFSQTGVINTVPQIVSAVRDTGANGLMLTADSAGALPFFAQLLPENGLDIEGVRVMGLTRWDTPPQTLERSGRQGGWFAVPDPQATADFNARYEAAYGAAPHILGALGYDAIRAAGETAATVGRLGVADLTASSGFQGANGVFRLLGDVTNQRAMAITQVIDNQVAVIDPAPRRLGGFGF